MEVTIYSCLTQCVSLAGYTHTHRTLHTLRAMRNRPPLLQKQTFWKYLVGEDCTYIQGLESLTLKQGQTPEFPQCPLLGSLHSEALGWIILLNLSCERKQSCSSLGRA